jgi:hypothetical protein
VAEAAGEEAVALMGDMEVLAVQKISGLKRVTGLWRARAAEEEAEEEVAQQAIPEAQVRMAAAEAVWEEALLPLSQAAVPAEAALS